MARRRLRLHHRIVIPFALVALVTTSAAAFVAVSVTSQALESRVKTQVLNTATLVGQSDFALNPAILRSVKAITGADVITFDERRARPRDHARSRRKPGDRRASRPAARREARGRDAAGAGRAPDGLRHAVRRRLSPRAVAARHDRGRRRRHVRAAGARPRAVTVAILIAAFLSLVGMIVVSQVVARRVTAPLDDLVGFTRRRRPRSVARARRPATTRSAGSAAFNDMLDRLDRSQDALVRSEKLGLAGLMAARVAHDIRNPLSSIKMQTQLLRARLRTGRIVRRVASSTPVLRDIQQVETVVRDLLELARPGELKRQPTRSTTSSRRPGQLAPQLTHRKIAVDAALADGCRSIALDAARFKQALLNVIGNAADAMPTGGTLTVAAAPSGDGSEVRLDVCDDGIGIDPAIRDRVFDPFVSTKRDGVGLGLVNAKAVVESHGGTIELAPARARRARARIHLTLPAARCTSWLTSSSSTTTSRSRRPSSISCASKGTTAALRATPRTPCASSPSVSRRSS